MAVNDSTETPSKCYVIEDKFDNNLKITLCTAEASIFSFLILQCVLINSSL